MTSPTALPDPHGLAAADGALPDGLIARLSTAGYGEDAIAALERQVPTVLGAGRLPLLQHAIAARARPDATLAALFCYGLAATPAEAERALGADAIAACLAHGVLVRHEGGLVSPWRITPFRCVMVASDLPDAGDQAVMGPGPTTDALAAAAFPAPGASVLDLGCGAGSLALAALRAGAGSAVAVDINPRAVAVAAVNASLNRLRLDCRGGDLLAPVAGLAFDLIVSQPPYVILAEGSQAVTFLHAGARGDELARRVLAEAPSHLAAGGRLVVHYDGPGDHDGTLLPALMAALPVRAGLALIAAPGVPPAAQAMAYASLLHGGFTAGYADAVRRHLDHCSRHGLKSFGRYTAVVRRGAAGWAVRIPIAAHAVPERADIDRLLRALDIAELPDAALLAIGVTPAPTAELVLRRPFGGPEVQSIMLSCTPAPWPQGGAIDEGDAAILDLLATSADLAAAAAAVARDTGRDPDEARTELLAAVRAGLRRGLLVARDG